MLLLIFYGLPFLLQITIKQCFFLKKIYVDKGLMHWKWNAHLYDSNRSFYHLRIAVFGMEPDLTREGGSIPVTLTLQEATGKNVMLLPIGSCDDGAHSQNEKINRSNYIEGVGSHIRSSRLSFVS